MMRKMLHCAVFCALSLSTAAKATDLISVYRDACLSDPAFKAAQAEFQAIRELIPLNVAPFLPQIALTGSLSRVHTSSELQNPLAAGEAPALAQAKYYSTQSDYAISLSQSIFNFANWANLSTANAQVKQAGANLCAAAQDLMIRTANAYFAVLKVSEELRFTQAEKKAIKRELEQNIERFQVGLIAVTAVYEAQARFDDVLAREIATKNRYSNRIEELRQITGRSYRTLLGIDETLPLVSPQPRNINRWIKISERQNYSLQAARYASEAARENIKVQFSGHLPIIDAQGSYSYHYDDNFLNAGTARAKVATAALTGTLPVTNGGATLAATRQARYQYQQALSLEELSHRNVVAQARNNFLGVLTSISEIQADKQAIRSSQSALDATQAAYEVGTRTMVDVLDAQSKLYSIQSVTVSAQYDYLFRSLLLKQTAGTLSPCDLMGINRWLKKSTTMITDEEIMHTEIPPHRIPDQINLQTSKNNTPAPQNKTKTSAKKSSSKKKVAQKKKIQKRG